MKRQKDRKLKDEHPRLIGTQYATGDQWRNNSKKNEEMETKQKHDPVMDVTGDGNKVQCPFHDRGLDCKSRKSRNTWSNRQIWPWSTE